MTAMASATTAGSTEAGSRDGTDLRTRSRWLAALLMPIGPAAVALLRYVLPYDTGDEPATLVHKVVTNPGAQSFVLWMGLVAVFTLVPGALAAGRLTRHGSPRVTAAAMLLLVPGYLALGFLIAGDVVVWSGAHAGVDEVTLTTLYTATHPTGNIAAGVFVLGHVIGTVLLGIALWRSCVVPRWAAGATAVSQPLHFVAAVILASHALDLVAWGLTALGMGVAAVAVLRTPDDTWDTAPARRR